MSLTRGCLRMGGGLLTHRLDSDPPSGGWRPRWRGDGKELFYLAGDGTLMSVRIEAGATGPRPDVPESLYATGLTLMPEVLQSFGVTPNGQRFLMTVSEDAVPTQSLVVTLNWQAALKP